MSSFDPTAIRKAVAEFTPSRPPKFQELLPVKDVIAELRQKGASYGAIAELLIKHCMPTSKTAITAFCHEVLGEIVRPHRRPGRKRTSATTSPNSEPAPTALQPGETHLLPEQTAKPDGGALQQGSRGPRIAQVRMAKPPST